MRCRVSYQRSRSWATLLLAVVLTYLCSNTLFVHTHLFGDKVVAHSHFYTTSADGSQHTHSQSQMLHLQMLAELDALQGSVAFELLVASLLCGVIVAGAYHTICREQLHLSLRAPPANI